MSQLTNLINQYSNKNLIAFLRDKLPSFKPDDENLDYLFQEDVFDKYESIEKVGEATINKDDVIIIASETTEPLTERTGKKNQYEIAKKILKHEVKDAALFVFYDSEGNFRFSFVKANYLGTKREFTEYKRYTYFVSPKQTNKTFIKQVGSCGFSSLDEIIEAFSVEPLNKQFYQEIAKAFYELIGGKYKQGTKTINADNPQLVLPSTPLKDNRKIYQEFAVRLIGRTIFCWFLKNKKSEAGIPLIPETWLSSNTVVEVNNQQHDYYHSVLEKLFFLVLNKREEDRKDYTLPQDANIIPFLNGGLFEAHPDDFFPTDSQGIHQISFGLKIPNSWFLELFKVLEQYNFTIDENSIYDAEVSIDPEMLGTIFENLLAEIDPDTEKSARKATGSFYTPREIVDYMVEQSLVQYLKTKTAINDEEALERLFKEGQETNQEDTFSTKEKDQILQALSDVKILDPACGSGAFPMGALHKIILALKKLDPGAKWWKQKQLEKVNNALIRSQLKEKLDAATSDYARKLGVIQHSIYGVDIQPIASEISKLRSFLSLVIDENIDDTAVNRGIEPLPNLEFKFVTANTLIGLPEEQGQQISMFDNYEELQLLEQLRADYLQSSGKKKEKIKERFLRVQKKAFKNEHNLFADTNSRSYKLISWNPFSNEASSWFDPQWMYGVDEFDIVIGNPPYKIVKSSNTLKSILEVYKQYQTADFKINLYALFYEFSINASSQNGIISLIIPDSSINLPAFKNLRQLILDESKIMSVSYYDEKVFENATVGKSVIISSQLKTELNNIENDFDFVRFKSYDKYEVEKINIDYVLKDENLKFNISSGDVFEIELFNKIKSTCGKVSDYYDVFDGINPGSDYIKNEFISFEKIDNYSKKIIDGKDFERYSEINWSGLYIQYSQKKVDKIRQYLKSRGENFTARIIKKTNFFEKEKIVTRQTADSIIGTIDNGKHYVKNSVHSTILKSKFKDSLSNEYLLAIYNSKLINWYYHKLSLESGRVFPQVKISVLNELPFVYPDEKLHINFKDIVSSILSFSNDNISIADLLNELDILIYKLYNLTHQEVLLIDPTFSLTEEAYNNYKV